MDPLNHRFWWSVTCIIKLLMCPEELGPQLQSTINQTSDYSTDLDVLA